jgi:hypothetical protein
VPDWEPVTDIEPTPGRYRQLPDGRKMHESRITVSPETMEKMWTGYICAACLEDVTELGAFPVRCPNDWCRFEIRKLQRARLEQDFAGEVEQMHREGWIEREEAHLERLFHKAKTQIHVRRSI